MRSKSFRLELLLLLGLPVLVCAQHHEGGAAMHPNEHMNQQSLEDLAAGFDSAARDAWQKPDAVLAAIGDVRGRTVMDIGSGTGYFSFRLAAAGAHVICADVDERFLGLIRERMAREGLSADRMELRQVPYDSSLLAPSEADVVLIVDTYHHIENRVEYFAEVRAGLKPGGKLVVIDFFKRDDQQGPPVAMKMAEDVVVQELVQAGYTKIDIDRTLLPYQYLIEAR
jgi:ubiquinone/menaquinone biosynthesis C-methylase UbiE